MGNGDYSLVQVGHIHQQLHRAIELLGGIQQPPMPTEKEETMAERYRRADGEEEIEMIAEEIYLALTGRMVIEDRKVGP